MSSKETNPHNFANLSKQELQAIAAKGGRHSHIRETDMDPTEIEQSTDIDHSTRGFAAMDPEKQHEIASKGGHAAQAHAGFSHMDPQKHHEAAVKGGHESQAHGGGFSNMTKDRLREVASKGGQSMQYKAHHGGFQTQNESELSQEGGTTVHDSTHDRGFAALATNDPKKHKEISAKGGRHSHGQQTVTD